MLNITCKNVYKANKSRVLYLQIKQLLWSQSINKNTDRILFVNLKRSHMACIGCVEYGNFLFYWDSFIDWSKCVVLFNFLECLLTDLLTIMIEMCLLACWVTNLAQCSICPITTFVQIKFHPSLVSPHNNLKSNFNLKWATQYY